MTQQHLEYAARRRALYVRAVATILVLTSLTSCGKRAWTPTIHPPDQYARVGDEADYLKVHMRDGRLYVLRSWQLDNRRTAITGRGALYDRERERKGTSKSYSIPLDDIVLLEANDSRRIQGFGIAWLGFWTTVYGVITGICVADPKACFGSCPTFYVHDGQSERLQAEGFSSSVARVLEERDVDALYFARSKDGRLEIRMTNEALETHAVRRLRLLSVPRTDGARVFAGADGRYYTGYGVSEPNGCRAPEGDCRESVRAMDDSERASVTDSTDLTTRENVYLEFPQLNGPVGLVLSARNTFVTTHVIYQSMAYMGSQAGEILAQLERGDPMLENGAKNLLAALGGIEIAVLQPDGSWQEIGEYSENGPIAADVQLFSFDSAHHKGPITVRLRMAQGNWRIGYAALVSPLAPVEPLVLQPTKVLTDRDRGTEAFDALVDPDRYLFTYPGDEYRLVFELPDADASYEFFLESQGYYYEWMRGEWLAEEDPAMLALILTNPHAALRRLAPAFKKVEPSMERLFWSSKFSRR